MFAGPITLGELAGAEQVRPPTMTRIVQALEEQGLVVKRIDGTDRRAVRLSATTKGRRVLIQARRRRTQALAPRIGLLSAREQSSLKDAIDVMVRLTMK
jgi:DNA-binding MarR family transcriptional regulator